MATQNVTRCVVCNIERDDMQATLCQILDVSVCAFRLSQVTGVVVPDYHDVSGVGT
jgi:hypothetical protein